MASQATSNQSSITKSFLEKILKKEIVNFQTSSGSRPGDNYTSVLISIDVTLAGNDKPLHLLFKTFPNNLSRQKLLEECNLFLKEYQVYSELIPELISFQKSGNNQAVVILHPATPELVAGAALDYINDDGANNNLDPVQSNFLLMVDMRKTYGFRLADKLKGQDYYHAKLVLDELAKFHALSHAYKVKNNLSSLKSKFRFMDDPFLSNPGQRPTIDSMIDTSVSIILNALQDYFEAKPDLRDVLRKLVHVAGDYFTMFLNENGVDEEKAESLTKLKPKRYADVPPIKEQWAAAAHGDCWTNNMLFQYDEGGKPTTVCLVDLQCTRVCCIMTDIVYYLYTSTTTEFRKEHLEEMLKWYYTKFTEYCEILKVKPFPGFTWDNFQRKYHRSKMLGLLFATFCLPFMLQRPESNVNMDTVVEVEKNPGAHGGQAVAEMFKNLGRDQEDDKLLRERFVKVVEELEQDGII